MVVRQTKLKYYKLQVPSNFIAIIRKYFKSFKIIFTKKVRILGNKQYDYRNEKNQ